MKLAKVKVEYTCGLTIVETASVDQTTGELFLPPRLTALEEMDGPECPPAFTLNHDGYSLHVRADGTRGEVTLPVGNDSRITHLWTSHNGEKRDREREWGK